MLPNVPVEWFFASNVAGSAGIAVVRAVAAVCSVHDRRDVEASVAVDLHRSEQFDKIAGIRLEGMPEGLEFGEAASDRWTALAIGGRDPPTIHLEEAHLDEGTGAAELKQTNHHPMVHRTPRI